MKSPSFRLKIALLSTVISGVVLVGFGVASLVMVSRQKTAAMDASIRSLATRHPGWMSQRRDFSRLEEALGFVFGEGSQAQNILLVRDAADGEVLYTSPGWPAGMDMVALDVALEDDPAATAAELTPPAMGPGPGGRGEGRGRGGLGRGMGGAHRPGFSKIPKFQTVRSAGGEWRIGLLGTTDTTWIIGLDMAPARAEIGQLRNAFALTLPAALFLVGLGGWLVAGRALRPMRAIATTAESVTARGLDQRIPLSGEDPEIDRVIDVLNRMMNRLEASFRQATRFSADASHELKTPLAIMQGELENALQTADVGSDAQRVFSNLLEETQRLKNITRSLLLLAQADAGQLKPALESMNLTTVMEHILEDTEVLGADTELQYQSKLDGEVMVLADPALLHTALLNLATNAVKYNEPGGIIRMELTTAENEAVLTMGNSGPGIPADAQDHVFTRFGRVDAARQRAVDGMGLGLSLAREIVRAHGGDVELADSRPGWTSFVLRLPRAL